MKIWVDADACPAVIKEILYRAAERTGVRLTLVANRSLRLPPSPLIDLLLVAQGQNVADTEIMRKMMAGDLVVTADIPLAAAVIAQGGHALDPRGDMHSVDNIGTRLSLRDFMDSLRASGVDTGGPPALTQGNRKEFASQLDRFLTRFVLQE